MRGPVSIIQYSFQWVFLSSYVDPFLPKSRRDSQINIRVWPCQREKDYCISNQLKCVGWAAEHQLSRSPAFYKSAALQRAVEPRVFKILNAGRNFSEMKLRSGSQPLKFFHLDDVGLEYYRTPCHRCKIPPPGFASSPTFFLHHRGFVRGFSIGAVVFWGD